MLNIEQVMTMLTLGQTYQATIVDARGNRRVNGQPVTVEPSPLAAHEELADEFGGRPVLWIIDTGWDTHWPIDTAAVTGESVVLTGPKGVATLKVSA